MVDHANSYGEKSQSYATTNNLGAAYFLNRKSNVDFVIKQRASEFNKLTEGFSASGGPSTSFLTKKSGSVQLSK